MKKLFTKNAFKSLTKKSILIGVLNTWMFTTTSVADRLELSGGPATGTTTYFKKAVTSISEDKVVKTSGSSFYVGYSFVDEWVWGIGFQSLTLSHGKEKIGESEGGGILQTRQEVELEMDYSLSGFVVNVGYAFWEFFQPQLRVGIANDMKMSYKGTLTTFIGGNETEQEISESVEDSGFETLGFVLPFFYQVDSFMAGVSVCACILGATAVDSAGNESVKAGNDTLLELFLGWDFD